MADLTRKRVSRDNVELLPLELLQFCGERGSSFLHEESDSKEVEDTDLEEECLEQELQEVRTYDLRSSTN